MKFILISLMTILYISKPLLAQDDQAEVAKMQEEIYKETYDKLSVGMTPDQKNDLKVKLDKQKQAAIEMSKLTKEEQIKKFEESSAKMKTPEYAAEFKKNMDNMTPAEKEMFQKMIQNGNKATQEIKR